MPNPFRAAPGFDRPLVDDRGHVVETITRDAPWFSRVSGASRNLTGSPTFAVGLLMAIAGWLAAGPLVDYSRTWELTATAGAPILALVLLVVGQHAVNRDDMAIQLKLDEVIRATEQANDGLIGIEETAVVELHRLLRDHRRRASTTGDGPGPRGFERRRRQRHARSDLGFDRGFVFRSPEGTVDEAARDLVRFVRLAESVDDATWLHHLRLGDYSRWFREVVGDDDLASLVASMERADVVSAAESRNRVVATIDRRYAIAG
jgi:low affinity Fe/Cu permease